MSSTASSNPSAIKVGLLFSGSMRPEMVDLIANTVHTSKDVDFYLITDREVKPFVPVVDPKVGDLLSIRRALMRAIHGGGIFLPEVNSLIKTKPELVKDMIFVADSEEQGKILQPLVAASGKPAIMLVDEDRPLEVADVANIPEETRVLLHVPKEPLKSIALSDTVAKVYMRDSIAPVANDHVSVFARELAAADVIPVTSHGKDNTQGIGDTKNFYNLYDAKTDTATFVSKSNKVTYSYKAKSGKMTANVDGYPKDYALSKEQDAKFSKTLETFAKIVAGPQVER